MADLILYGARWPGADNSPDSRLKVEMACIQHGGEWKDKSGKTCGLGKYQHFQNMRKLIWPELDDHRWQHLSTKEMLSTKVCTLMGVGGSGKTHCAAALYLLDYWCFPYDTVVLISSIDLRGLDLRVWGEMKKLHENGQGRFPWLAGHINDTKRACSTDDISDEEVRDLRKGIIAIPCVVSGKFVGLGKYIGIHQKRVRLLADEAQFMSGSFLSAFANLNQNPDFRAAVLGNPQDPTDPLGRAAEPKEGWASYMAVEKTTCWDTKFFNGRCVNLVGPDSPNFDYDQSLPPKFPYLPNRKAMNEVISSFGPDSDEVQQQCVGNMRTGMLLRRVVTRDLCRQFKAQDDVIWKGRTLIRVYFVDAAYGGDRCVAGYCEFGEDIEGKQIFNVKKPKIIPIKTGKGMAEDQIAIYVKEDCDAAGIMPENMGHDATGRGSLGTALARVWSAQTNPIEFGGVPTDRPVSLDHFVRDPHSKQQRLLLCSEHYAWFVTELWYSLRYCIEAGQMRNLPEDVMEELCMREWKRVGGNRIQVEPKSGTSEKPGMKQRTGRSPDLGDWLAGCLEMGRRKGFNISKLANKDNPASNKDWFYEMARVQRDARARHQLNYTA